MKDLDQEIQKDQIDIIKPAVNYEQKLLGSKLLTKGLILWEFNVVDKTLIKAEYSENKIILNTLNKNDPNNVTKKKIIVKSNCIYIEALNEKNAVKKIIKQFKLQQNDIR